MARCIQLARLGAGYVAPNPMVGAVIVHDGKIIGEGYHQLYGEAHAEVNAINSVKNSSILSEASIYVSLEPCAHYGKTPPCADLIVNNQFNRVYVGCTDPFSEVSGRGIERMRNAGIEVTVGVLEKECRELNKHFFTFHEKKRPYVFLKWAQSKNGLIDAGQNNEEVTWISSPETKPLVHRWRATHQAILVGYNTVVNDNPSLTVRSVKGKNPVRVVLDPALRLDKHYNIFNSEAKTLIINHLKDDTNENLHYVKVDKIDARSVLDILYQNNIQSLLVEGGAKTLSMFIESDLWDEACVIEGDIEFIEGTKAPIIEGSYDYDIVGNDNFFYYLNR